MADEITNEIDKLSAFIEPEPQAAGIKLRPFTAASLIILRKTGNKLCTKDALSDMDIAGFLFTHAAPLADVVAATKDGYSWELAVMKFLESVKPQAFNRAAGEIQLIISRGMAGQDYEVEQDKIDPN
jgi:hypothetical protein